jgi:GAF domain-containing protein
LLRSLRGPAAGDAAGRADPPAPANDPPVPAGTLLRLLTGIGTTLDEDTTCAEPAWAAFGHVRCSAAVVRVDGASVSGYAPIMGDPGALPDPRWAAAVARDAAFPAAEHPEDRDGTGDGGVWYLAHPAADRSRPALCVPLATGEHRYGVLVCAREGSPFPRADARLLALLAERTASHIRHAREYAEVSRTACLAPDRSVIRRGSRGGCSVPAGPITPRAAASPDPVPVSSP